MTSPSRYIMKTNQLLIRDIQELIFKDTAKAWQRVYSHFCKRHAELSRDTIMQFKFKGEYFHLAEDIPLRSGVKNIHPDLMDEFSAAYDMFVIEADAEMVILQNMLAHAIRISASSEDLVNLLPVFMHETIEKAGFVQPDSKPLMSTDQEEQFKALYEQHFGIFDFRRTAGAVM